MRTIIYLSMLPKTTVDERNKMFPDRIAENKKVII